MVAEYLRPNTSLSALHFASYHIVFGIIILYCIYSALMLIKD